MKISKSGVNLIKSFEGFSPVACKCVATEKYFTIGYGHYGPDVKLGQRITEAEAVELLKSDIAKIEKSAEQVLKNYDLNPNQYDALISFTYNCGVGNLKTLTANGTRTLEEISKKLPEYCRSGGVILKGLQNRRKKEQTLFNTPDPKSYAFDDVVADVIAGKYGNGAVRKNKLTKAGYDYEIIQELVNKHYKKRG